MLSYVLAGLGLALAMTSMAVLLKRSLNHRAANAMLVKLASARNVERMRKLCRVAPTHTYFAAIDAAVAAGLAARTREPAALEAAVEAAYDQAGLAVAARWKAHAERGLLGVIFVAGGLGLAVSDGTLPTPLLALSGVGAAIGLYLVMKRSAMVEALVEGRVMVLPPLVGALHASAPAGAAAPESSAKEASAALAIEAVPATSEALPAGALRVRIHRGDALVRTQTLDAAITKVGRMAASQLQLDDDDVSRMHAVIERGDEGTVVIDLGSSTGTRVNGEKVNKHVLRSGDVIDIGPFRLEVEIGHRAQA